MKITREDKDQVLAVLAANPKATTHPMFHSELVTKTGFSSPEVTTIRKELVEEGRVRVAISHLFIEVYLMVPDKRQQVIDLILAGKDHGPATLSECTGLTKAQVYQILLGLVAEGVVDVSYMMVEPSPQWLLAQEAPMAPELQAV